MRTQRYPSDLTDEQWALVGPLIPVYTGGRPRKTSLRDVLDAIFYILRTGCQWRFLPKDFPPKSTVWGNSDRLDFCYSRDRLTGRLAAAPLRLFRNGAAARVGLPPCPP